MNVYVFTLMGRAGCYPDLNVFSLLCHMSIFVSMLQHCYLCGLLEYEAMSLSMTEGVIAIFVREELNLRLPWPCGYTTCWCLSKKKGTCGI